MLIPQLYPNFLDFIFYPYLEKIGSVGSKYLIDLFENMRAVMIADGITNENIVSVDIGFCKGLSNDVRIRYVIFNFLSPIIPSNEAVADEADRYGIQSIPYNFSINHGNYLYVDYDKFVQSQTSDLALSKPNNPVLNGSYRCIEIRLSNIPDEPNSIKNVSYTPTSGEQGKLLVKVDLDLMNINFCKGGKTLSSFEYSFYSDSHFETCKVLCQWAESFGMDDSESGIVKKVLSGFKEHVICNAQHCGGLFRETGNFHLEHDFYLLKIVTETV